MPKLNQQTVRTFFHSLIFAAAAALFLIVSGHLRWAAGFGIGAFTSLFSLLSLKVCVPALFHRGATARATVALNALLICKVPIYALGLYFASRMGSAAAFAAFTGCALVPAVVSMEALGKAVFQFDSRLKRALVMQTPPTLHPAVEELSRQVAEMKAESGEAQSAAAAARIVREGAL